MSKLNSKKGVLQQFLNTPALLVTFGGDNTDSLSGKSLRRLLQHLGFSCREQDTCIVSFLHMDHTDVLDSASPCPSFLSLCGKRNAVPDAFLHYFIYLYWKQFPQPFPCAVIASLIPMYCVSSPYLLACFQYFDPLPFFLSFSVSYHLCSQAPLPATSRRV